MVLLESIYEGIITNSRISVRLLTTTSYLKKMRNLIYGYMLIFSCGMKKAIFPQIWSKIPFFAIIYVF